MRPIDFCHAVLSFEIVRCGSMIVASLSQRRDKMRSVKNAP